LENARVIKSWESTITGGSWEAKITGGSWEAKITGWRWETKIIGGSWEATIIGGLETSATEIAKGKRRNGEKRKRNIRISEVVVVVVI